MGGWGDILITTNELLDLLVDTTNKIAFTLWLSQKVMGYIWVPPSLTVVNMKL